MNRLITVCILAALAAGPAAAQDEKKEKPTPHHNRVEYGNIKTGVRAEHWNNWYPGFTEKAKGTYLELEKRSSTDFTIQLQRPRGMELYDFFIKRIPVSIVKPPGENKCDSPAQATILELPPRDDGKTRGILYSYTWLVCAGGGTIPGERLLEHYIKKYGNYDRKDYDRDQIVYYNVREHFEVRVSPAAPGEKKAGLLIKVIDNAAFRQAYNGWRGYIRRVENRARDKL